MRAVLFAISAGLLAFAQPAAAQPYNLTVAGYSPGGLVSTIGTGLDAALNAAYPGSAVTYQTSSGGLANAMLLERKSVPLAFISDTELNVVIHGKPPFKTPLKNLRMLFSPYSSDSRFQATHFLTTKAWADKYGIHSIADIAKKKPPMKIGINRPGNLDGDVSIAVLTANGISLDDIKKWGGQVVRAASREMTSLMLDRRLDVATFGISINHARIQEMEHGLDLMMITYDEATAKKVNDAIGAKPCQIKASEYKFLPKDTYSNCVGLSVVVRADMDEKLAYNVTKGIFEHIDKYKAAHRLLQKAVTLQSMSAPAQVPFHPGAAKYLREKGLLK